MFVEIFWTSNIGILLGIKIPMYEKYSHYIPYFTQQKTRLVVGDRFFAALAIAIFRLIDIPFANKDIFYFNVQEK